MASGQTLVWSHVSVWMGYLISVCKCACLPLSYMNVSEHALNVSSASEALAWPPTSWTLALQLNSAHTVNTISSCYWHSCAHSGRPLSWQTNYYWAILNKGQMKTYAMKLRPLKMTRGGADCKFRALGYVHSRGYPAILQTCKSPWRLILRGVITPHQDFFFLDNDFFSVFVANR